MWFRVWVCAFVLILGAPDAWAVPDRGMGSSQPTRIERPDGDRETVSRTDEKEYYRHFYGRNPVPAHRLTYSYAMFARVNPLGLIGVLNLGYRGRLMKSDSSLFRDSYGFLGLSARGSPAFGRVGAHAEIQPIALFKAWTTYEFVGYFGTFDQVTEFSDANVKYSDQTLASLNAARPALGSVLTLGGTLQAKVGPVAIRSIFQATRYDIAMEEGNAFFYDQYWDRLAPNRDFMFLNDFDILGFVGKARIGGRWTWSDGNMGTDEGDGALPHHRIGPIFAYQFHDRGPGARFDTPTLFVLAQWWLQHPYRTGFEQPQGLPLIAVGLAFNGDLLGDKPPNRGKKR